MHSPTLEDYTDYRKYVADALTAMGRAHRELAHHLGLSESMISQVLSGQRRLKHDHVEPLARFFGVVGSQRRYLHALIDLENDSPLARTGAWVTIQSTQRRRRADRPTTETMDALADLHVGVTQELAGCVGFQPSARWIGGTIDPPVTEEQAEAAMQLLLALGALEPDDRGGLRQPRPDQFTEADMPAGPSSAAAIRAHRQALQLADRALGEYPHSERHVSTMVLAIPEDRWDELLGRLREIETELLHLATRAGDTAPNRVYVLGFHVFPASLYTDTEYDVAEVRNADELDPDDGPLTPGT